MSKIKLTKYVVDPITFQEHVSFDFLPRLEDFCLDETFAISCRRPGNNTPLYSKEYLEYSNKPCVPESSSSSFCNNNNHQQDDQNDNDSQLPELCMSSSSTESVSSYSTSETTDSLESSSQDTIATTTTTTTAPVCTLESSVALENLTDSALTVPTSAKQQQEEEEGTSESNRQELSSNHGSRSDNKNNNRDEAAAFAARCNASSPIEFASSTSLTKLNDESGWNTSTDHLGSSSSSSSSSSQIQSQSQRSQEALGEDKSPASFGQTSVTDADVVAPIAASIPETNSSTFTTSTTTAITNSMPQSNAQKLQSTTSGGCSSNSTLIKCQGHSDNETKHVVAASNLAISTSTSSSSPIELDPSTSSSKTSLEHGQQASLESKSQDPQVCHLLESSAAKLAIDFGSASMSSTLSDSSIGTSLQSTTGSTITSLSAEGQANAESLSDENKVETAALSTETNTSSKCELSISLIEPSYDRQRELESHQDSQVCHLESSTTEPASAAVESLTDAPSLRMSASTTKTETTPTTSQPIRSSRGGSALTTSATTSLEHTNVPIVNNDNEAELEAAALSTGDSQIESTRCTSLSTELDTSDRPTESAKSKSLSKSLDAQGEPSLFSSSIPETEPNVASPQSSKNQEETIATITPSPNRSTLQSTSNSTSGNESTPDNDEADAETASLSTGSSTPKSAVASPSLDTKSVETGLANQDTKNSKKSPTATFMSQLSQVKALPNAFLKSSTEVSSPSSSSAAEEKRDGHTSPSLLQRTWPFNSSSASQDAPSTDLSDPKTSPPVPNESESRGARIKRLQNTLISKVQSHSKSASSQDTSMDNASSQKIISSPRKLPTWPPTTNKEGVEGSPDSKSSHLVTPSLNHSNDTETLSPTASPQGLAKKFSGLNGKSLNMNNKLLFKLNSPNDETDTNAKRVLLSPPSQQAGSKLERFKSELNGLLPHFLDGKLTRSPSDLHKTGIRGSTSEPQIMAPRSLFFSEEDDGENEVKPAEQLSNEISQTRPVRFGLPTWPPKQRTEENESDTPLQEDRRSGQVLAAEGASESPSEKDDGSQSDTKNGGAVQKMLGQFNSLRRISNTATMVQSKGIAKPHHSSWQSTGRVYGISSGANFPRPSKLVHTKTPSGTQSLPVTNTGQPLEDAQEEECARPNGTSTSTNTSQLQDSKRSSLRSWPPTSTDKDSNNKPSAAVWQKWSLPKPKFSVGQANMQGGLPSGTSGNDQGNETIHSPRNGSTKAKLTKWPPEPNLSPSNTHDNHPKSDARSKLSRTVSPPWSQTRTKTKETTPQNASKSQNETTSPVQSPLKHVPKNISSLRSCLKKSENIPEAPPLSPSEKKTVKFSEKEDEVKVVSRYCLSVFDDLYYTSEDLATFRYHAFMEDAGMNIDDYE